VQGTAVSSLFGGADDDETIALRHKLHAGKPTQIQKTITRADGTSYVIEARNFPLDDPSSGRTFWVSIQRDISQRIKNENSIRVLTAALEHASDAIIIARMDPPDQQDATVVYVNEAFLAHTRYARAAIVDQKVSSLLGPETDGETVTLIRDDLTKNGLAVHDLQIRRADDTPVWISLSMRTLRVDGEHSPHYVAIIRDVSERKEQESRSLEEREAMEYAAMHDPLTGLFNRRALEERLAALMESARTGEREHALAIIDLDGFRQINEICGLAGGDLALRQIADMIRNHVRQDDFIARYGGDEFALILENCALRDAIRSLETLRQKLHSSPIVIRQARFSIAASIGVSVLDRNTHVAADAIALADASCYSAKRAGGNRIAAELASEV